MIGLRVMTPEYASPEQMRGEAATTVSDVYSLGVVLYRLLTGRLPFRLASESPQGTARAIGETEPQRPSTVVTAADADSDAADGATGDFASRTSEGSPERLRRRLRGDLDNIVLMALRKEPERRYQSVEQLSEDIRRHLATLPVLARRDTLAYRGAKFVRRNSGSDGRRGARLPHPARRDRGYDLAGAPGPDAGGAREHGEGAGGTALQ